LIILRNSNLRGHIARYTLQLAPWKNSSIGGNSIVTIEKVGRYPNVGIKGKVVAILKVVGDIGGVLGIDDRVDEVEVEGELAIAVEEAGDLCAGFAGCVGEEIVVRAFAHLYLCELETFGAEFALKGYIGPNWRTQPLVEILCNKAA